MQALRGLRPTAEIASLGTASERIRHGLAGIPEFDRWAAGFVDRAAYVEGLDAVLARQPVLPLSENECALSARLHWRASGVVAGALGACAAAGMLDSTGYDVAGFAACWDRVTARWDHGGRTTFIFPEEAQLLYAFANIARPRTVAFLGSYYGYWAVWAIAGAGPALERAVLLDVDGDIAPLAAANLKRLGLAANVEVLHRDAIDFLDAEPAGSFDLMVLDAEGPEIGADARFLGKRIYEPITEAALPRLRPGGCLVAHNILLDRLVSHRYFDDLVSRNADELAPFLDLVRAGCGASVHVETTEGVGIYQRSRA